MGGGQSGCGLGRTCARFWVTLALAWGAGAVLAMEGLGTEEEEEVGVEVGLAAAEKPCGTEGWAQDAIPPGAAFVAAASFRGPGNNDTRSNKALPILLWWSGSLFPHFPGDTERIDCPRGSCLVTRSRRVARYRRTKALIFYGTDFRAYEAPLPRLPHQTWALFHEESPMNNYVLSHSAGIRLFNYTATFRRESDYPLTLQWLPDVGYLRGPAVPLSEKDAWRRKGYAPVLYMQSHCDVPSDRDRYVRELMKYIQVDSYGKCLHNRELPSERLRDTSTATTEDSEFMTFIARYKFHLALENAICDDYMTEKLWRPMHLGAVPVYRGSPAVRDWMPNNLSIIIIDDFDSPQELAKYLDFLDKNGEEYMKYLEYKNLGGIQNQFLLESLERREWGVNDMTLPNYLNGFECFICDRENTRIKEEQEHRKSRGKIPAPKPRIAQFKHMGCPMPTPGFGNVKDLSGGDRHEVCLEEMYQESFYIVYFRKRHNRFRGMINGISSEITMVYILWKDTWLQDYWQSLDQGEALTAMIHHNESHQGRFWDYMHEIFLKRTRQH